MNDVINNGEKVPRWVYTVYMPDGSVKTFHENDPLVEKIAVEDGTLTVWEKGEYTNKWTITRFYKIPFMARIEGKTNVKDDRQVKSEGGILWQ